MSRRPTWRFAYWIGILRCPSWTNTTAETTPITISGKKIRSIGPPFHQAASPSGKLVRIEAKIRIEMPFPMPRFVICSPIHMRSTVPAVSVVMMSTIRPGLACRTPWFLKRNA